MKYFASCTVRTHKASGSITMDPATRSAAVPIEMLGQPSSNESALDYEVNRISCQGHRLEEDFGFDHLDPSCG